MKDWIGDILSDTLALTFTGLGISFIPVSEYVGGMFLALAGAAWARHMQPERGRYEFWAVMLGGFFAAHIAVIAAHVWMPGAPPQVIMAITGFFSRFIARFTLRAAGRLEDHAEEIGDTVGNAIGNRLG